MKYVKATAVLVVGISVLMGCSGTGKDRFGSREARQQAASRHAETVDSLVPPDGGMRPSRLRTVIEAIRTVRPQVPADELPENYRAVRRVLESMSQSELNRVKAILPAVEKRRMERGED